MSTSCNSLQNTAIANLNPNRLPNVFLSEGFFSFFLVDAFSTFSSGPLSSSNSLSLSLYSSSSLSLLLAEFLIKIRLKKMTEKSSSVLQDDSVINDGKGVLAALTPWK